MSENAPSLASRIGLATGFSVGFWAVATDTRGIILASVFSAMFYWLVALGVWGDWKDRRREG